MPLAMPKFITGHGEDVNSGRMPRMSLSLTSKFRQSFTRLTLVEIGAVSIASVLVVLPVLQHGDGVGRSPAGHSGCFKERLLGHDSVAAEALVLVA
jgi:hypothetical protein